jgi:hypothetical protein
MKTLISIPLMILILFTGVSVKFASHYCGGYMVATKVSLTGELATCGMESGYEINDLQQIIKNHCCDNIASAYSISNNYLTSAYNIEEPGQVVTNLLLSPSGYLYSNETFIALSVDGIKPPGNYDPNSVDQKVLCIFRI